MLLEYAKVRESSKSPTRSNPSDAGMDVYYCSDNEDVVAIPPLGKVTLGTGLRFSIPHGYAMEIKNRSGMASKKGLIVGAHLIDPGYEGEVKIDLHNVSNQMQVVKPGDKIAQFVVYPIVHVRMIEREEDALYENEEHPIVISDRGDGGFGSTGGF